MRERYGGHMERHVHTPAYHMERLVTELRAQSLIGEVFHHPPLHTVEEARALRGELGGAYVKNLFLRDRSGSLLLLVCLAHREVNLQALRRLLGYRRLSFASPELMWEHLGVRPGSVSPLAVVNAEPGAFTLFADQALRGFELNNFHPLSNEATVQLRPADWEALTSSWGFPPQWVDLDQLGRAEG